MQEGGSDRFRESRRPVPSPRNPPVVEHEKRPPDRIDREGALTVKPVRASRYASVEAVFAASEGPFGSTRPESSGWIVMLWKRWAI